jgi:hypothetical protein
MNNNNYNEYDESNNNNNNVNKIFTPENDYEKKIEEEGNLYSNKNLNEDEIMSNNSDNSNAKTNTNMEKANENVEKINTNIDITNKTPKNGLDMQVWSKNCYYIGYYKDGKSDGLGKLITGNSKYFGEFKDDKANGFGIFHNNSNETIYEGYWLNDSQNDYVIEKWADDSIFYGE